MTSSSLPPDAPPPARAPTAVAKRHTKLAEKERERAAVTFSARLREARQRAGFANHDAVAKQLGLTREGYGRLERGRVMPRADVLLCLGRFFGVSVDWLLGLSDDP
jgi:DNA-binding XRE family transcriptional regulator